MLILNLKPFPHLATERLVLRELEKEDAAEIMVLRSDVKVNEFLDRPKSTTLHEALEFINKIKNVIAKNESVYWAIALKNNNQLIGTICYWNISKENDIAEIGYELLPGFQGKGIMQEAISKVILFGFDTMKLKVITALSAAGNHKSIQLLERNNFKLDTNFKYGKREELGNNVIYFLVKKTELF
jgi:ribosomal-protein-alanine N-acetyltransferase